MELTEKELYEEARRLKFMAREKRKIRLEYERKIHEARKDADEAARAKAQMDTMALDKEYKADLDNRIRKAMLEIARIVKQHNLAFEAPDIQDTRKHLNTFKVIDVSPADPARSGALIQIRTMYNGFNWD